MKALRTNSLDLATDAAVATALVDRERIDWREILLALGLVTFALRRLTTEPDSILDRVRGMAEPGVRDLVGRFVEISDEDADLATWGYVQAETPDGFGLIGRGFANYDPTLDLIDVACQVAEVIESDTYHVGEITAGEELYSVWLPGARGDEPSRVLDACRGCVTATALLHPGTHSQSSDQMFLVFIVEAKNETDARRLHNWARVSDDRKHCALSLQHGSLLCLVIARSVVVGVDSFETTDSLMRFFEPLDAIVAAAASSS